MFEEGTFKFLVVAILEKEILKFTLVSEITKLSLCYQLEEVIILGGDPLRRTKENVRVRKLENSKEAGKDDVTGEVIRSHAELIYQDQKLCNMP